MCSCFILSFLMDCPVDGEEGEGREANVKPLQSVLSMIQSIVSKH